MNNKAAENGILTKYCQDVTARARILAQKGYILEFGARPLKRVIQQEIAVPVAQHILKHADQKSISITEKNGVVIIS